MGNNVSINGKEYSFKDLYAAAGGKPSAAGTSTSGGGASGGTPSGSGESWMPWVLGGGGALLAHALTSPMFEASDEEKRKESVWSKLLRTIIPLGVGGIGGVAGYALGNALNKKAQAKPAAPAAAPAAPAAAPSFTDAFNAKLKELKLKPLVDVGGDLHFGDKSISGSDFASWQGKYGKKDPTSLMEARRDNYGRNAAIAHGTGTALEAGGGLIGVLGAIKPWVGKAPPKYEPPAVSTINAYNLRIEDIKRQMATHRQSLQRAQSAYQRAQRAVDTAAMGRAEASKARANAALKDSKAALKETKGQLTALTKRPMSRLGRSLRNVGVGAATAGAGLVADAIGDNLSLKKLQYEQRAARQQQNLSALRTWLAEQEKLQAQAARAAQPQK